jgi:peroxisomal membrane protein 2
MARTFQLFITALTASTLMAFAPASASNHAFLAVRHNPTGSRVNSNAALSVRGGGSHLNLGVSEAWGAYNIALEANPLIVKSVTAGVILGAADLAGQALENFRKEEGEEKSPVDLARAVRFSIFGLVLQAPWNHFYYNILDGVLPPTANPFSLTTGVKTFIDQFVQAPIFTVLIFVFLGALEGKAMEDIQKQLKDDYKDTIIANCKCNSIIDYSFDASLFRRLICYSFLFVTIVSQGNFGYLLLLSIWHLCHLFSECYI